MHVPPTTWWLTPSRRRTWRSDLRKPVADPFSPCHHPATARCSYTTLITLLNCSYSTCLLPLHYTHRPAARCSHAALHIHATCLPTSCAACLQHRWTTWHPPTTAPACRPACPLHCEACGGVWPASLPPAGPGAAPTYYCPCLQACVPPSL